MRLSMGLLKHIMAWGEAIDCGVWGRQYNKRLTEEKHTEINLAKVRARDRKIEI